MKTTVFLILASTTSIAALVMLRINHAPAYLAVLVLFSYLLWFLLFWRRSKLVPSFASASPPDNEPQLQSARPELDYFERLLSSLEYNWSLFSGDFEHCEYTLKSSHNALDQAMDMATSTGLLALNSMFEAAKTGDIGKGFVTVSQDLIAISDRSSHDIDKVRSILKRLEHTLKSCHSSVQRPLKHYLEDPFQFPLEKMEAMLLNIKHGQYELAQLAERHKRNPKLDVRWLQLGEAVRRLLNELTNALYQLEVRLEDLLTDMRLMRLSGTLGSDLVSQITKRLEEKRAMEEQTEKNT